MAPRVRTNQACRCASSIGLHRRHGAADLAGQEQHRQLERPEMQPDEDDRVAGERLGDDLRGLDGQPLLEPARLDGRRARDLEVVARGVPVGRRTRRSRARGSVAAARTRGAPGLRRPGPRRPGPGSAGPGRPGRAWPGTRGRRRTRRGARAGPRAGGRPATRPRSAAGRARRATSRRGSCRLAGRRATAPGVADAPHHGPGRVGGRPASRRAALEVGRSRPGRRPDRLEAVPLVRGRPRCWPRARRRWPGSPAGARPGSRGDLDGVVQPTSACRPAGGGWRSGRIRDPVLAASVAGPAGRAVHSPNRRTGMPSGR